MKIHWQHEPKWVTCGAQGITDRNTTDDPGEVTCESCLAHIERQFEPVSITDDREASKAAKATAVGRAKHDLIENHRDEYEIMLTEYAAAGYDEALKVATERRERFEAWGKKRDDTRRAELETELETLR